MVKSGSLLLKHDVQINAEALREDGAASERDEETGSLIASGAKIKEEEEEYAKVKDRAGSIALLGDEMAQKQEIIDRLQHNNAKLKNDLLHLQNLRDWVSASMRANVNIPTTTYRKRKYSELG